MKTLVIGGGMSGLVYGILCARNNLNVTICEQNSRVGKKLSQTGNGKCNLGNVNVTAECFNSSGIVQAVTRSVTVDDYVEFLRSCGIFCHEDAAGRMYPLSDSAANVVDCFRHTFTRSGGKLLTDTQIVSVTRSKRGAFTVTDARGNSTEYDSVVLACGSGSSCIAPNVDGIVPHQYFTECVPSLVPVKVANPQKNLDGIRARANVSLYVDGAPVATERGEVQFKDYGLSGICIFNLSARIARDVVSGIARNYLFGVDVVTEFPESELTEILQSRIKDGVPREQLFMGILHNKLAECVLSRAKDYTAQSIANAAKNLQFTFLKLLDFSKSQVTAGGIDEKFVDKQTLALDNGIIALGEVLNVDGLSGGYNLYFAAASAMHAFKNRPLK